MIGILLLSHGTLCEGVLGAMEVIGCSAEQVRAIPLYMESEMDAYTQCVSDAIDELDTGEGVLVIVDLISGTPFNRSCELYASKHIAVVTGMSLPLCLTALDYRSSESLESIAELCVEAGRDGVLNLKTLLDNP